MAEAAERVRPSAVAGLFYPGRAEALAAEVDGFLAEASATCPRDAPLPKALIVPHAGYVYSGAVAASAYARLKPLRAHIRRVVLLGPAHRIAVRGLALPGVAAFASPLGSVPLDLEAIGRIKALPGVALLDEAHAEEHSLEVHLPFLQRTLADFRLVPIVVGEARPEEVANVLARLWGGPETLIVVSSDLSHYHDYDGARTRDDKTRAAIESLAPERITPRDACGARPLAGLLRLAQVLDMRATTLDLRNSGDTAGPRERVVGYGAWSLTEGWRTRTTGRGRLTLLCAAARSIRCGLTRGRRPEVRLGSFGPELEAWRSSFITLTLDDRLRGCIGSLLASRPLVADVAWNAFSSAFEDPRFDKLDEDEFPRLELSVSVLGAPARLRFADEAELLRQLRPGQDGLILKAGDRRGVFLPQVWRHCPEPRRFLARLKRKAGLPEDFWSGAVEASRFSAESFSAPVAKLPL